MTVQPTKNDPADRSDEGHLEIKRVINSTWLAMYPSGGTKSTLGCSLWPSNWRSWASI